MLRIVQNECDSRREREKERKREREINTAAVRLMPKEEKEIIKRGNG